MIEKYLIKSDGEYYGSEDLKEIANTLESKFNEAIVYMGEKAVYFKKFEEGSITVLVDKKNIGAIKLDKNLIRRLEMKIKLEKVDEIFDLAKKIENMNIEEFMKKMR